jgi:RES domain-containing protein
LICAELITVAPLKLIDLRGDRLLQMGVPTDAVRASSHRLGQNWSLAFWSHQEQPDGIIYASRLNQETNLALYDRALAKIELSTVRPFLEYRADVAALIREFKIAIV